MKYGRLDSNTYLLRLEKGEEITSQLFSFCEKNSIINASINGVGSVENVTLAHYDVNTKQYSEQLMSGIFEVTNLTGTVGTFEDKPLVHAHVTLSDQKMNALGGHLVKGVVSATLEVILNTYPSSFGKIQNEEIGLKLFDFPESE